MHLLLHRGGVRVDETVMDDTCTLSLATDKVQTLSMRIRTAVFIRNGVRLTQAWSDTIENSGGKADRRALSHVPVGDSVAYRHLAYQEFCVQKKPSHVPENDPIHARLIAQERAPLDAVQI